MAYREVDMWEILEVLRGLHRGEPKAAIERATGRTLSAKAAGSESVFPEGSQLLALVTPASEAANDTPNVRNVG